MTGLISADISESLFLAARKAHAANSARLFFVEYSGRDGVGRPGRAATLDGAIREAVIRILRGQYGKAHTYDARFGGIALAVTITRWIDAVQIRWTPQAAEYFIPRKDH